MSLYEGQPSYDASERHMCKDRLAYHTEVEVWMSSLESETLLRMAAYRTI